MDGFLVSSGPFHIHQPSRGSVRVWVRHGGLNVFVPLCGKQGPLHLWMGAIQDRVSAIRRPQPMSCQMYASPKPVVEWVTFWVGQIFVCKYDNPHFLRCNAVSFGSNVCEEAHIMQLQEADSGETQKSFLIRSEEERSVHLSCIVMKECS